MKFNLSNISPTKWRFALISCPSQSYITEKKEKKEEKGKRGRNLKEKQATD